MTAISQIDGGFFCAPKEYWSKARLNLNGSSSGIHLIFPVNGRNWSSFYLIPVGNATHPDLHINSCWYMAIATEDENGRLLYLKFQADPAGRTGRTVIKSGPPDHFCVFLKGRGNLIGGNLATSITFIDDRKIVMHLHYDEPRDIMVFKEECAQTAKQHMYWLPKFEVAIRVAPPTPKSVGRIFVEEVVKEARSEILTEAGWWLFSTLLGV